MRRSLAVLGSLLLLLVLIYQASTDRPSVPSGAAEVRPARMEAGLEQDSSGDAPAWPRPGQEFIPYPPQKAPLDPGLTFSEMGHRPPTASSELGALEAGRQASREGQEQPAEVPQTGVKELPGINDQAAASEQPGDETYVQGDQPADGDSQPPYMQYMEPLLPYQPAPLLPELAEIETRLVDPVDLAEAGPALPAEPQPPPDPALLLPDLYTLPAYHLRLVDDPATGRMLLRFSNSIVNLGPGPLELRGVLDSRTEAVEVVQNMFFPDGSNLDSRMGEFYYHGSHNHWHWDGFSLYEVYSILPDGSLDEKLYTSGKVGYCVRDDRPAAVLWDEEIQGAAAPESEARRYVACDWDIQGLSVGWTDVYLSHTPGQFVEITGLEDGVYALRSLTDPDNILFEIDKSNNEAVTYFRLSNFKVELVESLEGGS